MARKAALLAKGGMRSTLMGMLRSRGLTGLLRLIGLKGGVVGAFVGNKVGEAIGELKGVRIINRRVGERGDAGPEAGAGAAGQTHAAQPGSVTSAVVGQLGRFAAANMGCIRL